MKSLLKIQAEYTEYIILIHKCFELLKKLEDVCQIGPPFVEIILILLK